MAARGTGLGAARQRPDPACAAAAPDPRGRRGSADPASAPGGGYGFLGVPTGSRLDDPGVTPSTSVAAAAARAPGQVRPSVRRGRAGTTSTGPRRPRPSSATSSASSSASGACPVLGGEIVMSLRPDRELDSVLARTADRPGVARRRGGEAAADHDALRRRWRGRRRRRGDGRPHGPLGPRRRADRWQQPRCRSAPCGGSSSLAVRTCVAGPGRRPDRRVLMDVDHIQELRTGSSATHRVSRDSAPSPLPCVQAPPRAQPRGTPSGAGRRQPRVRARRSGVGHLRWPAST